MKKQMVAIMLATTMAASVVVGCGSNAATTDGVTSDTTEEGTSAAASENAADTATSVSAISTGNVTTKKTHMGDREIDTEVVDIGKSGSFSYWSCFTGDSATWEQERVDAFNEAYADLGIKCEVQFVPDGAGINNGKLLSAISGGTAPNLLITDNPTSAYQYAAEGSFLPLDQTLKDINLDVSTFFDGCKDVMYYNDTCYLVPQDTNIIMLYYNPDLVKEAGLDPDNPPKTLDDLNKWSDALTVQESDGTYSRFGLIPWLDSGSDAFTVPYIFGANPYDSETGKLNLTDDQMIKYMTWVQDFAQKYDPEKINAFTSGLGGMFSPDHPFMTGKVAMTITGNWFTEALRQYAPDVNYQVCAVPVPDGGRADSSIFGCNVFAIPSGTTADQAELASLYIKFCEQGSVNEDNFAQWRSIPVIDSAFDDVSLTKSGDEIYALEREIANSPENGIPALCAVSAELSTQFQTLREQVIYDNVDPKSALQDLQDSMQATLDSSN
jgi:multiple sugar transport system substrate-binding protein